MFKQFDLNEFAIVVAASILLAALVEFPFGNIKKLLLDTKSDKISRKSE
jgi:hypothetical protein